MTPAFQGEIQFRRYSDTSTQGQQVVFAVQDREALESFVGMEGKRFMAVLVQIGDDEQPALPTPARPKGGEWAKLAGMWCEDSDFIAWANTLYTEKIRNDIDAAALIRDECGIGSRAELDHDAGALRRFNERIRHPFMKYMQARGISK